MPKILRIATRKSPLALWQAQHIGEMLLKHWSTKGITLQIELVPMITSGDQFLKQKLLALGGKGLFVKELEEALLSEHADIAVHSMKDVPSNFPDGLCLEVICTRENPLDALVSLKYPNLESLALEATIGTVSLRRQSQLLATRPDLQVKSLRGNIQTRLSKLASGDYDAIVLAAAGLQRMGLDEHIREIFNTELMLPACGQGALGIECRSDDEEIKQYIRPLNDPLSELCVRTERRVNAQLGGNCHVPLAVYCSLINQKELVLRAKVLTMDGKLVISNRQEGPMENADLLADQCAQAMLANGAFDLLQPTL